MIGAANFQCSMFKFQSNLAMAQWNADSTEMDTYNRYRIGGYGEAVAAFKNYGINRFSGTSTGNSD